MMFRGGSGSMSDRVRHLDKRAKSGMVQGNARRDRD